MILPAVELEGMVLLVTTGAAPQQASMLFHATELFPVGPAARQETPTVPRAVQPKHAAPGRDLAG
jgi:hypothetical protein